MPFLGGSDDGAGEGAGQEGSDPKPEDKGEGAKPDEVTEQSFIDGIKKDAAMLGDDESVELDADMIKAIAPVLKETGVSVDQANRLANALAKVQMDQARAAQQERIENFNKLNREAVAKWSPQDFKQINAGINKWFRKDGPMNYVIRHSELGSDPEFLALMHHIGAASMSDGLAGAAAGSGAPTGDGNGIDGMSKLW